MLSRATTPIWFMREQTLRNLQSERDQGRRLGRAKILLSQRRKSNKRSFKLKTGEIELRNAPFATDCIELVIESRIDRGRGHNPKTFSPIHFEGVSDILQASCR